MSYGTELPIPCRIAGTLSHRLCQKISEDESIHYEMVNATLLNEFLKAHHQIQELEVSNAQQQKQIDVLTAALQKVSAQLEMSKAAPQTVLNNR